ncbi:MAG TPA: hypothetical protein PK263_03275, partial [bacterium]|nr:hypothetical protein [bacterium]
KIIHRMVVIFVVVLLVWSIYQKFIIYYADSNFRERKTEEVQLPTVPPVDSAIPLPPSETPAPKSTTPSKPKVTVPAPADPPPSPPSEPAPDVPDPAVEAAAVWEKELNFFIEIALHTFKGTPASPLYRWTKSKVYVGGKESDLGEGILSCTRSFIADFNAVSKTVKLEENAPLADIKLYVMPDDWIDPTERDVRASANTHENDAGEITGADIIYPVSQDTSDCYTIKHEMFHAIGFGHSDLQKTSVMGVPLLNYNTGAQLTDIDKKAINLLYNLGVPLKSNEQQIRDLWKTDPTK